MMTEQQAARFKVGEWARVRDRDTLVRVTKVSGGPPSCWVYTDTDGVHWAESMLLLATPEEIEARVIEEGDWGHICQSPTPSGGAIRASATTVRSYLGERERGGWRRGDWCHATPEQYRVSLKHAAPAEYREATQTPEPAVSAPGVRSFEVGEWIVDSRWNHPRRVTALVGPHYSLDGAGTFSAGYGDWRHATTEEIEARPIAVGEWIVATHAESGLPPFKVTGPCDNIDGFLGSAANGASRSAYTEHSRHATPEEYRVATQTPEPAVLIADELGAPDEDVGLEDSRDELIPPSEEEVRLAGEMERLDAMLLRKHEACVAYGVERDAARDELRAAQARCLQLESAREEACAARDAALCPELPPMLWDRITGRMMIDSGMPPDCFGAHAYYIGEWRERGGGPEGERDRREVQRTVAAYPGTLTPVEPPRPEVKLDPVPAPKMRGVPLAAWALMGTQVIGTVVFALLATGVL